LNTRQLLGRLGYEDHMVAAPRVSGAAVSVDVGCGYVDGVLQPVYATVSLDLNMRRVERPLLRRIRARGSHPLGADAHHLPLRDRCAAHVYLRAILEHLEDPEAAMKETRRVLIPGGAADVILPIVTNLVKLYLIELFVEFPFSVPSIVVALWRAHLYWGQPGYYHRREVSPSHLRAHFGIILVRTVYESHKWFRGPWRGATEILTGGRFIPSPQGLYVAHCVLREDEP